MNEESFRILMGDYLDKVGGDQARIKLFTRLREDRDFKKLVKKDLDSMVDNVELDIQEPIWRILLVQSVLGHAQNGHGQFGSEYIYPHATIPDIIAGAGLNVEKTKEERQRLVDEVYQWVDLALDNRTNRLKIKGQPLLGVNFLRQYKVDAEHCLKGMVLAGYMDNFQARMDTVDHFEKTIDGEELRIGGGETYLVDPRVLLQSGLDFNFLADTEHNEAALSYLRELGIIKTENSNNVESTYIRRKAGPGTSDDLAFIMIGKRYGKKSINRGISAMLGAFVVDAIDTYDKCVKYPAQKGLDEKLAEYIEQEWERKGDGPLVTKQEIRDLIYYSAKSNSPRVKVSSSHRRLVQFAGEELYRPTLLSHMAFVRGKPTGDFEVGFSRMKSENFYKRAQSRVNSMLKNI